MNPATGDNEAGIDDAVFALLTRIESGDNVFKPREPTDEGRAAFQSLVQQLLDLRAMGLIRFLDGRMMRSSTDAVLLVGPCDLTPAGIAALAQDRRLGPRSTPAEE